MIRVCLTIIILIISILSILAGYAFDMMAAGAHASGGGPYPSSSSNKMGIVIFNIILFIIYIILFLALGDKSKKDNEKE